MNLLRVLLRSVCGSHPSDVPPKSKISVQIEQNGNGRRSGAFLHISFKNSSICKAFGVRQRPPQGAEFVCVPCGANNSKSVDGNIVRVRPPPPAPHWDPKLLRNERFGIFYFIRQYKYKRCREISWKQNTRMWKRRSWYDMPQYWTPSIGGISVWKTELRVFLVLEGVKFFDGFKVEHRNLALSHSIETL